MKKRVKPLKQPRNICKSDRHVQLRVCVPNGETDYDKAN